LDTLDENADIVHELAGAGELIVAKSLLDIVTVTLFSLKKLLR
jgi:hypothetical protein